METNGYTKWKMLIQIEMDYEPLNDDKIIRSWQIIHTSHISLKLK